MTISNAIGRIGRAGSLAAAVALAAWAQQQPVPAPSAPPDTRAADEAALRALIKDLSAAPQAKDAAKSSSPSTRTTPRS